DRVARVVDGAEDLLAAMTDAMARAEASFVVPFSYITLVFAAVYDFAIFAVIPDAITALGAAIIITGGAVLAWREGRAQTPQARQSRPCNSATHD
ncbi:MAG: DMT family transporter, partial [Pseudomonadota bacterium]